MLFSDQFFSRHQPSSLMTWQVENFPEIARSWKTCKKQNQYIISDVKTFMIEHFYVFVLDTNITSLDWAGDQPGNDSYPGA